MLCDVHELLQFSVSFGFCSCHCDSSRSSRHAALSLGCSPRGSRHAALSLMCSSLGNDNKQLKITTFILCVTHSKQPCLEPTLRLVGTEELALRAAFHCLSCLEVHERGALSVSSALNCACDTEPQFKSRVGTYLWRFVRVRLGPAARYPSPLGTVLVITAVQ